MAKIQKSKTDLVREILDKTPSATPTQIIAKLAKKNVTISSAAASTTKWYIQQQDQKKSNKSEKEEKEPAVRAGAPKKRKKAMTDRVSLSSLKDAKNFIESIGGIDEATKVLNAIEDIGGLKRTRSTIEALAELA